MTESDKQKARKDALVRLEQLLKQFRKSLVLPVGPSPDEPEQLRKWMKELEISQSELSREAEVAQQFISAILSGSKPFSEPSRTAIWNAVNDLHLKKIGQDLRQKIEAGVFDSDQLSTVRDLSKFFQFKTPMEQKDEEIALLTKERDLAREQRDTLKQLVDMNLVDRCAELEKKLADAFQQIADFHRLFAFKGAAVAGDELQSQLEQRERGK